ncbi:hypothetical protein O7602_10245 [Micromonospora sp. WMMD1128]|uniref:hypothetical protein n=1 Tax=Micromonospora sp. WMMD1128 TaxID=3015150 RepID=UPI00248ACC96|nr:hypothetical protein [Micromonospora sp. WMMD1128]WBB75857.1 hypothetical protein O7602_10245 [Micromonospora sp. WMMD1128]
MPVEPPGHGEDPAATVERADELRAALLLLGTRLTVGLGRPASAADQLRLLAAFLEVAPTGSPAALAELARDR